MGAYTNMSRKTKLNDTESKTASAKPEAEGGSKEVYEWLQCVVVALIACVLLFSFFARVIDVRGESMVPTLLDGDKIVITRLTSSYDAGDMVVLQKDSFKPDPIVKRIIATEGQTVDIDFEMGVVYVNGFALEESYVNELTFDPENFKGPQVVPEGCVFVLGDNRNNSLDSRYAPIGMVDERHILGKVIFRILPLRRFGALQGW